MNRERIGVLRRRRLERTGEERVASLPRSRGEMGEHRLAHAVVVGLDRVLAATPVGSREVRGAERLQVGREVAEREPRRAHRRLLRHRDPGHRQQLEHRARPLVEARDAGHQRVVEVQVRGGVSAEELGVAHELVDEERVTRRLLRDPLLHARRDLLRQQRHELEPLLLRQARERQRTNVPRETERRSVGGARLARRAGRRDQEERGGRRAQDLGQRREAVGVGPLQVIDHQHERALGGEVREELSERMEEERAALLETHEPEGGTELHPREATEHGECIGEDEPGRRHDLLDLLARKRREVDRQGVHDPVDRLVGHVLALVAAPREDEGPRRLRALLLEALREAAHERALADAGLSLHHDRDGGPGPRAREALLERAHLCPAPHERRPAGGTLRQLGGDRQRALEDRALLEAPNDVRASRATRGDAREEVHAEIVEVLGHARSDVARTRRVLELFALEHLGRRPFERVEPP